MLEDALDFADLAEQFSKQDTKKQTGELLLVYHLTNTYILQLQ